MIFKYPNASPLEFYILTSELLDTLAMQTIPFDGLKKIHAYHEKLTFNETASFIACHHAAAKLLAVPMPEPQSQFGEGYQAGMVGETFNAIDSNAITEILQGGSDFHSMKIGNVIVVVVDATNKGKVSSWTKLKAGNLSAAVLEAIYGHVGYIETHFGPVIRPTMGTLTMAEVYNFLHRENH